MIGTRPGSRRRRSRSFRRCAVLAGTAFLASCVLSEPNLPGSDPSTPGVVLIVVDTLRADHLSQYGYSRATSLALEFFSRQATLFEQCYAPASWTTPSTASILTGLLPMRHGAELRGAALDLEATTLAEILRDEGFATLGVSFNHNITRTTAFDQGFSILLDFEGESSEYPDIAKMRATARDLLKTSTRPFFLYLHPMNVHGPYLTPEEHLSDLLGSPPGKEFRYSKSLMDSIMKKGRLERRGEVTALHLQSHRDQYDTAIRYSMDQIARVFGDLQEAGLYENSVIVLTADHGEELYDHQGFGHGYTLYEELLRVPLWIKLPNQRNPRVIEEPVSLTDLLPTILEVLDLTVPEHLDGRSLAGLLNHGIDETVRERVFVSETRWPGRFEGSSVLAYPWKLIHVESNYEGREADDLLYHLVEDPLEQNDVANEHAEVVERLTGLLEESRQAAGASLRSEDVSEKMNEDLLKALGYDE